MSHVLPEIPSIFDFLMIGEFDPYINIAIEKMYAANYLENNSDFSELCKYHAYLLRQEAENWTKITEDFNIFMKKGIFHFLVLYCL